MRIVESIANWYEDRGWRIVREIALVFAYIFMFLGVVGCFVVGIIIAKMLGSFWWFLLFLVAAVITFFLSALVCGFIKGDIYLIEGLKEAQEITIEEACKEEQKTSVENVQKQNKKEDNSNKELIEVLRENLNNLFNSGSFKDVVENLNLHKDPKAREIAKTIEYTGNNEGAINILKKSIKELL